MTALRILVADDHEIVRRGLCAILESDTGWEVCGEAADGREAVEKTRQLNPDVVILDIGMPSLNGLEATRQILRGNPLQRVLILTVTDAEQLIEEVLKAGARGFVLKADAANIAGALNRATSRKSEPARAATTARSMSPTKAYEWLAP